jgi:hypothetical protein
MKRKKNRRFRKPPKLYQLTTRYKLFQLTLMVILAALRVGCRVERFVGRAWKSLPLLRSQIQSEIVAHFTKILHYLHIRSQFEFVAYEIEIDAHPPVQARFDSDSFKIGIDSQCSVTMSSIVDCFEDLVPVNGPIVGGIAGGLKQVARGTFCFRLEDQHGVVRTIKCICAQFADDTAMPTTMGPARSRCWRRRLLCQGHKERMLVSVE